MATVRVVPDRLTFDPPRPSGVQSQEPSRRGEIHVVAVRNGHLAAGGFTVRRPLHAAPLARCWRTTPAIDHASDVSAIR